MLSLFALPDSQMSDDEKAFYASMTADEFTAYMETVEEEYQQKNQQNQQKQQQEQEQNNENQQQEQNNAYAAYAYGNGGRRNLYQSLQNLCGTCEEQCINNQNANDMQDYYEDMEKLFEESMCTESGNGYYMGHTCGGSGRSVELAMFTDEDCMYLAPDQNAYTAYQNAVANVYEYDADGDGQADNNWDQADLALGYMEMVSDMFQDEFSCSVGAVRSYDGSVSLSPAHIYFCLSCASLFLLLLHATCCHYRIPVKPVQPCMKTQSPRSNAPGVRTADYRTRRTTTTTICLLDMTLPTVKILLTCAGSFLPLKINILAPTPSKELVSLRCSVTGRRTLFLVAPSLVLSSLWLLSVELLPLLSSRKGRRRRATLRSLLKARAVPFSKFWWIFCSITRYMCIVWSCVYSIVCSCVYRRRFDPRTNLILKISLIK